MARPAALGPMQATAARQMRRTADTLEADHPETVAGAHVRDAARLTETGRHDGAKRHLEAAMNLMTPQNLTRHGIRDDEGHATAKHHMHQVHRHLLHVQDIEDAKSRNEEIRTAMRAVRGQISATDAAAAAGPPQPGHMPPAQQQPARPPAALAGRAGRVIDLKASTAWMHERRGPGGEWIGSKYVGVGQAPAMAALGIKVDKKGYIHNVPMHLPGEAPGHEVPGFVGTKGSVFGRKLSLKEAVGASEALGTPSTRERGERIAIQRQVFRKQLSKPQRVIFDKLIKRGRAPHGAFIIARTFQPGMLESAVLANTGRALELARIYRYKHGWIKLDQPAIAPHGSVIPGTPPDWAPLLRKVRSVRRQRALRKDWQQAQREWMAAGGAFTRSSGPPPPPGLKVKQSRYSPSLANSNLATLLMASSHGHHIAGTPYTYKHGWRKIAGQSETGRFGAGTMAGSFEHINAIEDLAERAGAASGDPGRRSPTMRSALLNVAKAVGGRDMRRARVHLAMARWANQHEARGYYTADLRDLTRQLELVPKGVTGWEGKIKNPLSVQHPGEYRSSRSARPPAHPTAGARRTSYQAFATELSARTAMLERTPAPLGRPGGPGLYHVKGLGHTPYFQQVVKALIEKRGMPKDKAYKIAWGALRKWRRGGGHVHPEVRAAASGALAGEAAKGALAHSHANGWTVADCLIELACEPIELFNPYHAPPGAGGGQFTTQQGAGQGKQGKQKQQKQAVRREHRHDQAQRAVLTRKIAGIRAQIRALQAMLPSTHRKSRASTPAKKGAAATSAKQAAATKAAAAKTRASARKPAKTMSPATIHAKIAALRATLQADLAQLRTL